MLPSLKGLKEKFGAKGFEILALTKYDPNNTQEKIDAYAKDQQLAWPVVITDAAGYEAFGVYGIPHAALVDAKGIVRWIGNPHSLTEKMIAKYFAESAPAPEK